MAFTSGQWEKEKRSQKRKIIIDDYSVCHYCKSTGLGNEKYCPNCKFPQGGEQEEMFRFINEVKKKKYLLSDLKRQISFLRIIFIIVAIEYFIYGYPFIAYSSIQSSTNVAIIFFFISITYILLGIYSFVHYYYSFKIGVILYLILHIISVTYFLIFTEAIIVNFISIIFFILFVSIFTIGYRRSREYKNLEAELKLIKTKKAY